MVFAVKKSAYIVGTVFGLFIVAAVLVQTSVTMAHWVEGERLTVVTPDVFTVSKQDDGFVLALAGQIPMGTECDATQEILGYHVVPKAAVVEWYGGIQARVVVAQCAIDLTVSGTVL